MILTGDSGNVFVSWEDGGPILCFH
jgi:hypothetical protein